VSESLLEQARAHLATTLGTIPGTSVHDRYPAKVTPPAVVCLPGDPYVEHDPDNMPYGHGWLRFEVVLIVANATNPEQDRRLDDLICQVWAELLSAPAPIRWWPLSVDRPSPLELNDTTYLHTRVQVRAPWRTIPTSN